jgi:hypothetical protein
MNIFRIINTKNDLILSNCRFCAFQKCWKEKKWITNHQNLTIYLCNDAYFEEKHLCNDAIFEEKHLCTEIFIDKTQINTEIITIFAVKIIQAQYVYS